MNFHTTGHRGLFSILPLLGGAASLCLLALPACKKEEASPTKLPPANVTYLPAARETVILTRELPGRLDAVRVAQVRARVPGILLKRKFEEGAVVEQGDILFLIDPAPLMAAKNNAEADLARVQATLRQDEVTSARFAGLLKSNAISMQEAQDAAAAVAVTKAEMKAAEAVLESAKLNLGYTTVTATINGTIGKAIVTEGALVGQGDATLLAIIRQFDPIYFDFTQSTGDLFALRKAIVKNGSSGILMHGF